MTAPSPSRPAASTTTSSGFFFPMAFPPRAGNRIELLTHGEEAFQYLVRIIDEAKTTIHITTYILGREDVGREIVSRLARRATEGVSVRLLLDDVGSWR